MSKFAVSRGLTYSGKGQVAQPPRNIMVPVAGDRPVVVFSRPKAPADHLLPMAAAGYRQGPAQVFHLRLVR